MNIGIPLYPDFDPLDVIGPYEIFSWMARMWGEQTTHVLLVAATLKPVTSFSNLTITPVRTFVDCPALDVLFVPGGSPEGVTAMMKNEDYISFLRKQGGDAAYISSVCVGALLLAAAGLLNGYKATTHWAFVSSLQLFPKIKVVNGYPRYVIDGNRVTGGGISSGLDEALKMVALITKSEEIAKQIQLTIQYNPRPPFKDGDPCTAEYSIYERYKEGAKTSSTDEVSRTIRETLGREKF
jgi:transcriptional regulator GlxA family with amidase domain